MLASRHYPSANSQLARPANPARLHATNGRRGRSAVSRGWLRLHFSAFIHLVAYVGSSSR